MKRLPHKFLLFPFIGLFFVFGCSSVQTSDATTESSPTAPETTQTILAADSIVRYYKIDSSAYITQQQHKFIPSAGRLEVNSVEPTGQYQYRLEQNQFTSPQKASKELSDLPASFFNQALATAVFYSLCAGGSLLDTGTMPSGEPLKIQGQWYTPLTPSWPKGQLTVTLLRNQSSSAIEWVKISDSSTGLEWMARNYNLRYNSDLKTRIPRTVDVFDIREGIASKSLIVKFEYKDVRLVNKV
jgi:hypothetical protein